MSEINPAVPIVEDLPTEFSAVYRKVTLRLLPFLFICYIFNYLDRVNIGFAKLQFMQDLGFSNAVYGLGAGLFFVGYMIFEIPSNLLLKKQGARKTFTRIMFLWGLISIAMLFVKTPTQLYVMRFLLGVAEAGFFPGIIFYLTCWFPSAYRARIIGVFVCAMPVSGMLGGPLSGWILHQMNDVYALKGWQWLFFIEGIPSVLLGLAALWYLDDGPQHARWLSERERHFVLESLAADRAAQPAAANHGFAQALKDPRVYAAGFFFFAFMAALNAVAFWTPTVFRELGVSNSFHVGLLTSIPWLAAIAGMAVIARRSDRTLERRWHTVAGSMLLIACYAALPLAHGNVMLGLLLLTGAAFGGFGSYPVFWTIPSTYLSGNAAAGGIAFISSLGGVGAFLSTTLMGWAAEKTGSVLYGYIGLAAVVMLACVVLLASFPAHTLQRRA